VDELGQIGLAVDIAVRRTTVNRAVSRSEPAHPRVRIGVGFCERDEEFTWDVCELSRVRDYVRFFSTDFDTAVSSDSSRFDIRSRFLGDTTVGDLSASQQRLLPVDVDGGPAIPEVDAAVGKYDPATTSEVNLSPQAADTASDNSPSVGGSTKEDRCLVSVVPGPWWGVKQSVGFYRNTYRTL